MGIIIDSSKTSTRLKKTMHTHKMIPWYTQATMKPQITTDPIRHLHVTLFNWKYDK